ncbi:MAG: hypothetical protein WC934_06840 [Acidithiobacillus sp.]|jgi:hypothetical protein|uniref:hypothetical protein n=1 Tax=Acidithiobacillus sp. TaxID=1872118 RepID=UPI0035600B5E
MEKKKLDLTEGFFDDLLTIESKKSELPLNIFELPLEMTQDPSQFFTQSYQNYPTQLEFKNKHITKKILIDGIVFISKSILRKKSPEINDTQLQEAEIKIRSKLDKYNTSTLLQSVEKLGLNNICNVGGKIQIWENDEKNTSIMDYDTIINLANKIEYEIKSRSLLLKNKDRDSAFKMYQCGTIAGNYMRNIGKDRKK